MPFVESSHCRDKPDEALGSCGRELGAELGGTPQDPHLPSTTAVITLSVAASMRWERRAESIIERETARYAESRPGATRAMASRWPRTVSASPRTTGPVSVAPP